METFNYKQVRAGDFRKACSRIKDLYSLKEELEVKAARSSAYYTFPHADTGNHAQLINEITSESKKISGRRKFIKVLILIFSLIAMSLLRKHVGYILCIIGCVVCVAAFLISWFGNIGTDTRRISTKLIKKYSAKLREAKELDQVNAASNAKRNAEMEKKAEHDRLAAKIELKKVRDEIAYYGELYDRIIETAKSVMGYHIDRGLRTDMERSVNNTVGRICLRCSVNEAQIINGQDMLLNYEQEEFDKFMAQFK